MKTVALIPVKLNSKRLPQKNVLPFYDGTPLMTFIQRACLQSEKIDEVYVYCSDENVKKYILDGVKFIKRPEFLDGDKRNANDVIREFIKIVDADIYVNAHATSPFATTKTIDTCIDKVASGEYDSAFCAKSVRNFLWKDGKPLNYNLGALPRTQDLPEIFAEAPISYVFPKETFLKFDRRIGEKPYICEVDTIEATDIDYPQDFEIADAIYKEIINKQK